ncbi:MAG: nitrate reductase maturation protein NarM [Spirulina sp. SIO3F2]|nr:nitrate reductase maturation protein NarM [Spirulina sp. SIO3F2]
MVFFEFEADFVTSLRCIPMGVRLKLDTCGVKLKLQHWHSFSETERQSLVDRPCDTPEAIASYRDDLQALVRAHVGEPASTLPVPERPPWLNEIEIPEQVHQQAKQLKLTLNLNQWFGLEPAQRFALIKLSRPGHENRNFLPAFQEFGLAVADDDETH